ncbi:MAG TPA: saccharopine dehydrogenase NADP-binding domain-containing protein [Polyangiaceae bacterium]|nr:saccharopine dehydrogenase NADP-binding domain-containing protein [Polyangiaceae bacterium]
MTHPGAAENPIHASAGEREFDVVLFGASGFTGKLVAEYLARNYGDGDLRWALAGRSLDKLGAVRAGLASITPSLSDLPLLIADSSQRPALDAIARRTRVVCTTVGPYARYGNELVAACVAAGTDYCDLTGEVQWIRRMVDAHAESAQKSGARIVHCCGFDSIPSDLGTLMLQEHAIERHGAPCSEVKVFVTKLRGGASGGTVASLLGVMQEAARDRDVRRILVDPYSLNPAGERSGPDKPDSNSVRRDPDLPGFTAPFVMAAINTRVVRRSNALLGYRYGRDFRYREVSAFSNDVRGFVRATQQTFGLGGFVAVATIPPLRSLLQKTVLPKPGEGPNAEQRRRGLFEMVVVGKGRAAAPFSVRGRVVGHSDPGYGETSIMLAESALCLARDGVNSDCKAGVLTPASAMGAKLLARLRRAGMTFEISPDR